MFRCVAKNEADRNNNHIENICIISDEKPSIENNRTKRKNTALF